MGPVRECGPRRASRLASSSLTTFRSVAVTTPWATWSWPLTTVMGICTSSGWPNAASAAPTCVARRSDERDGVLRHRFDRVGDRAGGGADAPVVERDHAVLLG